MGAVTTPTGRNDPAIEGTIDVLDEIIEQISVCELPQPPETLLTLRETLIKGSYDVLVVGEAKRGKSSFVNALLGRPILPTGIAIATSQVFRIGQADRELFRIRYEDDSVQERVTEADGTQRPLAAPDLARYGSQVAMGRAGAPRADQLIRWIEVEVPTRLLPPGVHLLDTPGLGSLYGQHAIITQRFLQYADAVIYVLDSERPVGEQDLEFIERILLVTPEIFFVQTKFDLFNEAAWKAVQHRSEEILREHFQERLTSSQIWPVSSALLTLGVELDDGTILAQSRYGELVAGLESFLRSGSGLVRASEALAVAATYHATASRTLSGRLTALKEESKQQQQRTQQQMAERTKQFTADWGPQGRKRSDLNAALQRAIADGKSSFTQALAPAGDLVREARTRIRALQTMEQAVALSGQLEALTIAAAASRWRLVCEQVQARCAEILAPFAGAADALMAYPSVVQPGITPSASSISLTKDVFQRLMGAHTNAQSAHQMAVVSLTALVGIGAVGAPVVLAGAAAAGLWGLWRGWKSSERTQLKAAQQELERFVDDKVYELRQAFLSPDLANRRSSIVESYFSDFQKTLQEQIQAIVERKSGEAQAEATLLQEATGLEAQQRAARIEQTKQQQAAWASIERTIGTLVAEVQESSA